MTIPAASTFDRALPCARGSPLVVDVRQLGAVLPRLQHLLQGLEAFDRRAYACAHVRELLKLCKGLFDYGWRPAPPHAGAWSVLPRRAAGPIDVDVAEGLPADGLELAELVPPSLRPAGIARGGAGGASGHPSG